MTWESVPEELKRLNQWILWNEKKLPLTPEGAAADTTKQSTWSDFDTCRAEYLNSAGTDIRGLGFVLTKSTGIVGLDLDNALDMRGDPYPWCRKILNVFPPTVYVERSPSGAGLHILCRGTKPGTKCRREIRDKKGNKLGEIEVYDHARYLTMTGVLLDSAHCQLIEAQSAINTIYARVLDVVKTDTPAVVPALKRPCVQFSSDLDLEAVIERSQQAEKYALLIHGPLETVLSRYGNDHSRAVYALSGIIAFYTPNFMLLDQIFNRSVLCTGKWQKGKWLRLGPLQFNQQRLDREKRGDIYDPDIGRVEALDDFADIAAANRGQQEFERHIELLYEHYAVVRRDLLSESLHGKDSNGAWQPIFTRSVIAALRADCNMRGKKYKKTCLEDYLYRYERSLAPELLLDLPIWDNTDRIAEMSGMLKFADLDNELFADLFRDWLCKLWQRIEDPYVQNRCLILSGRQGIGKDVWIKSCLLSLGRYFCDLTLSSQHSRETDIALVMSSSLCMFISEFDKTNVLGIETLKDLITKESFTFVRKYDRDATTLLNRCSIIGACNPENILRDVTGNRRFLICKLDGKPREAIAWNYPRLSADYSLQILAQGRDLAAKNYRASAETEETMRELTALYTPDDTDLEIVLQFEAAVSERCAKDPFYAGRDSDLFSMSEIDVILSSLCRNFGCRRKDILGLLKAYGCRRRTDGACLYGTRASVLRSQRGRDAVLENLGIN